MRLSHLVVWMDTDVAEVERDCEVGSIELCAKVRGEKALTYLEKEKFLPMLEQSNIAAVICTAELAKKIPVNKGILISDAPDPETTL